MNNENDKKIIEKYSIEKVVKNDKKDGEKKKLELENFRLNIRSKILDRIHDKNLNDKNHFQSRDDKKSETQVKNYEKINRKNILSKEWNQTLSRLLKNDPSFLMVNRREGIDFFIKSNNNKKNESDNENSIIKKGEMEKKNRKSEENEYLYLNEPTRRTKKYFKDMIIDKSTIVADIIRKPEVRKKIEKSKISEVSSTNFLERFALLDPWNYRHTVQFLINRNASSFFYRFLNWCYAFFFPYEGEEDDRLAFLEDEPTSGTVFGSIINNNRLTFNVSNLELKIYKNNSMNDFDKHFGRVLHRYESYIQTTSIIFEKHLKIIENILEGLIYDIENSFSEHENCQNLKVILNELFQKRSQMLNKRRSSLLSLLQVWDKANQNRQFARYVKNEMIKLELIEEKDKNYLENEDKKQLEEEQLFLERIRKLISIDSESVILLRDGRQVGEPRLKSINFRHDFTNCQSEENNEGKGYLINLSIMNQTFGSRTEILQQFHVSHNLKSNRCLSLLLSPTYLIENSPWSYQIVLPDRSLKNTNFVPILSVYEIFKNNNMKNRREEKFLYEVPIIDIPEWHYSSKKTKKQIFEMKNREENFNASLEFETFWNCVPTNFQQDSIVLNREKNKINDINNLKELEMIHNRVLYLSAPTIELLFQLEHNNDITNFKIGLIEQILKKKIDLDFERLKNQRNNIQRLITDTKIQMPNVTKSFNFCTDNELELNRRFKLFIQRSKYIERGQMSRLNFIPLTNVSEIFYNNILLHDYSNQEKVERLIEFLQKLSRNHFNRIFGNEFIGTKKRKNKKDRENSEEKNYTQQNIYLDNEFDNEEYENLNVYQESLSNFEGIYLQNSSRIAKNAVQKLQEILGFCSYKKSLKYKDIILEPEIESIEESGLFNTLTALLFGDKRRKLNPTRKERNRRTIQAIHVQNKELQLLLNIHSVSSVLEPFQNHELFLKLSYENQIKKSSLSFDQNWNETFCFRIRFDSSKIIQITLFARVSRDSKEILEQYETQKKKNYHSEIIPENEKIELCIGWLELSLKCLLYQSKIEGIFLMTTPYLVHNTNVKNIFNHNSFNDNEVDDNGDDNNDNDEKEERRNKMNEEELKMGITRTSLSLFMTTDPQIDPSIQDKGLKIINLKAIEETSVVEHCQKYQLSHQIAFPNRPIFTIIMNTSGEHLLISRYLSPIQPPEIDSLLKDSSLISKQLSGNKMKKVTIREKIYETLLIRFVSLLECDLSLPLQIKLDSQQFLSTGLGSDFEHSILLACWFQYLGRNAFILYGNSFQEGNVFFVIVFRQFDEHCCQEEDLRIINPMDGQEYSLRDVLLPVQEIFCIVTNNNVYSNIQKSTHPSSISFNLHKTAHWSPLFNIKDRTRLFSIENISESKLLRTIQPERLIFEYDRNNEIQYRKYEEIYESFLRDRLMNWRRKSNGTFTAFNRACSENIREMLNELEEHWVMRSCARNSYSSKNSNNILINFNHQLKMIEKSFNEKIKDQITDIHNLIGYLFTIQNPSSIDQIRRRLFCTGLHRFQADTNTETNNSSSKGISILGTVEFVVSVRFHFYSTNAISGWAYVGVLTPKKRNESVRVLSKTLLPPVRIQKRSLKTSLMENSEKKSINQ